MVYVRGPGEFDVTVTVRTRSGHAPPPHVTAPVSVRLAGVPLLLRYFVIVGSANDGSTDVAMVVVPRTGETMLMRSENGPPVCALLK